MNEALKARFDRYLAINAWLKKRYSGKGFGRFPGNPGWLIVNAGGEPTRYSVLDLAFFKRYVIA